MSVMDGPPSVLAHDIQLTPDSYKGSLITIPKGNGRTFTRTGRLTGVSSLSGYTCLRIMADGSEFWVNVPSDTRIFILSA